MYKDTLGSQARVSHAACIIYRPCQWPSRPVAHLCPHCPGSHVPLHANCVKVSVNARRALFLPRDARYGCLNSRGEPLGAFSDLISSKTPLLKPLNSNIDFFMAVSDWDCPVSDRLRLFRNRWDNYKESGQSPGQASTEPVDTAG